jgi:predicted TIM-barrel fold metal-dependent hydrolase
MIVDAHAHLGYDEVFDEDFSEEALLTSQRENGIDVTIVQPGTRHDLASVQRQHDAIADLVGRYPGRFRGIANPNPHLPEADYVREVRRCVEELHFVGLKVHPFAHAVQPLRQPGVDVQCDGGICQRTDRPLIKGHRVAGEAVEVSGGELNHSRPEDTLALILGKPELEGIDDLRIDLKGSIC